MSANNIRVEITDATEFHCFRLVLQPKSGPSGMIQHGDAPPPIEIMLHARALVELIHEASVALCDWQAQTSGHLIQRLTGMSEDEARKAGLIA